MDRKTGRIIGSSRYCYLNPKEREIEIGYTFSIGHIGEDPTTAN
jgi:hypothetical protein